MKKASLAGIATLVAMMLLYACGGGGGTTPATAVSPEAALAATIRADTRLALVRDKAKQLAAQQLTAGTEYPAVFIRDLNTFIEIAIQAQGATVVRSELELFLANQGDDGSVPDDIRNSDGAALKGTVETDQESSLVQAVGKYVAVTGDTAFLSQTVAGVPVIVRLENAITFLYTQRFSAQYALVWGGTRADWGDIQPEDVPGTDLTAATHPSISIYDNAMLGVALASLQTLESAAARDPSPWAAKASALRSAVRAHLWTGTQFVPHLYLDKGSPFPPGFDEARIYFQGGTAVAIQAGFLDAAELSQAFARMVKNKVDSGSGSVGVTLYPPYPAGSFANTTFMGFEYFYQNGGDWPWFGARIVQQMIAHDQVQLAYQELGPMLDRVLRDDRFFEWYTRDGLPRGSSDYRGSAGQIAQAIDKLQAWAAAH